MTQKEGKKGERRAEKGKRKKKGNGRKEIGTGNMGMDSEDRKTEREGWTRGK